MFWHHVYHHVWQHLLRPRRLRGLWGVYLSSMLRHIGMSIVGIFIPVYIYSLTEKLTPVFFFYLLTNLLTVITAPFTGWFMKQFGADRTALLGVVLRVVFLLLLTAGQKELIFLWPAALIWGIAVNLTWLPHHYTVVAEDDGDGRFGQETAQVDVVQRLASAVAPFIGGLLIVFLGYSAFYAVGISLVAASALPLLVDSFNKSNMRYESKDTFKDFFKPPKLWVFVSMFGGVWENLAINVLRPLFVFLAIGSVAKLGSIESVALLVAVAVTFWTGKWIDKKGFGVMKIGVVAGAFALLLLPFLQNTWQFFLHHSIYMLVAVLAITPFLAATYQFASYRHRLTFLVQRSMAVHSGATVFYLILIGLAQLGFNWGAVFGLGSLGLLMSLLILKGLKDVPERSKIQVRQATT